MPPVVLVPLVVAGIAGGAKIISSNISASATKKIAAEGRDLENNLAAQDKSFLEQQNKEAAEQGKQILASDTKLAEQQLVLEAGRQKLDTLATLESFKRKNQPIVFNPAPQPVRKISFFDRINLFIQGLF